MSPDQVESGVRTLGAWGVLERVARTYCVLPRDILGVRRFRTLVTARHYFWALLRWTLGMSFPELGSLLGVDHTTVLHGVRRVERRVALETGAA